MTEGSHVITMVDEDKQREKHCIYKLPPHVTDRNKNAYKPRVISFGPYHHHKMGESMVDMEPYKKSALARFLQRCGKSMDDCVEHMMQKGLAREWMDAYDCLGTEWQEIKFVELMVTDGSFMLEVLIYYCKGRNYPGLISYPELSYEYPPNHRVFSHHGQLHMIPDIERDMYMLENQLPISVLVELLSMSVQRPELLREIQNYLLGLIANFCDRRLPDFSPEGLNKLKTGKHVLDVFRQLWIGDTTGDGRVGAGRVPIRHYWTIPSAIRLHEAGVAFKDSGTDYLSHVEFLPGRLGGILKIPGFLLGPTSECWLLNILAFERYHAGTGMEATSYLYLLGCLLAKEKDVSFLKSHGMFDHSFEEDLGVAKLFNAITADNTYYPCPEVPLAHFQVLEFCGRPLIKLRGHIIHTYFTDPWIPLLRFAGSVIFGLTLAQTIYTVWQYYK